MCNDEYFPWWLKFGYFLFIVIFIVLGVGGLIKVKLSQNNSSIINLTNKTEFLIKK